MDIEEPDNHSSDKSSSIKKNEMEEEWSNQDIFEKMLEINISEHQQKADSDHQIKSSRHYKKRNDFRKILNSSSSNDRLIPSSLKHDSSRENSERAHKYFQTQNSQDQQSFHKSFKKKYDEMSIENMVRDSSSEFSERSWSRRSFHQILPQEFAQNKEEQMISDGIEENQISCNCKKSKCLKLYCECFQRKLFCNKFCKCHDCGNHKSNQKNHEKAIMRALARNAYGFEDDVGDCEKKGFNLGVELDEVKKGCKCKKTHCIKKYCECYNNSVKCGVFCRCEDCYNTQFHHHNKAQQ